MGCTPSIKQLVGQHPDHSRTRTNLEEMNDTDNVTMADIHCMLNLSQFSLHNSTISHIFFEEHSFRPEVRCLP